jgi:antitoxin ParD1/3/4
MPQVEKVSVSMTSEQAELMQEAVQSGAYANDSEIVLEAISDWSTKWEARKGDVQTLRMMWIDGKASGAPTDVDFDNVLEEARAELKNAS